ncbi:MAG: DEAD/DEAH box helicase [Chthonomonadales bacterium]
MNYDAIVEMLRDTPGYADQIAHIEYIPGRKASYAETELPLHPILQDILKGRGIDQLYLHQAQAIDRIRAGENVVSITPTASGKSMIYLLPTIEAVLEDHRSRALFLFPTKALAQDQMAKLNEFGLFPKVRFATYDGDTPQDERTYVRSGAHIVFSNPDMLHTAILPGHTQWVRYFANLKFVVLDEIHTYRGVFGAHVSQVMRRLRRICRQYGSDPQFIGCSATIANPGELFQSLTGLDATVIDEDGSPAGKRTFVFWNPPPVTKDGARRSTHTESAKLFAHLTQHRLRTLTFAKARKSAELIVKYTRESLSQDSPDLEARIKTYRAGFTAEQRRDIERGLQTGELMGVAATSALELGVDIGDLDATILTGYPGTIASAWQQAGRSGRDGRHSLSALIAMDNPLDQYLMRHPDYFFGRPHERSVVNTRNKRIRALHMECAAFELPLGDRDWEILGPGSLEIACELAEAESLVYRNDKWYYRGDNYPARLFSIRSASTRSYRIRDITGQGALLGEVEEARAFHTIHEGAIYLHQGDAYLVHEFNQDTLEAKVCLTDATYYTEPREVTNISIAEELLRKPMGATEVCFGEVVVSNQVFGYRRKQLYTDTTVSIEDLDLPEQVFETEAFWYTVPADVSNDLMDAGHDLGGSIHAAEHACIGLMPLHCVCDRWDIGGVSASCHFDTGLATVFVYDGYAGGIGIAEESYTRIEELLLATLECIVACPCTEGCPSCIQSPKCGNNNEPLDKAGAIYLLARLLKIDLPKPVTN